MKAVIAIKIKDAEVKAAEIAANAVGSSEIATDTVEASELKRVTKLIFAECTFNAFSSIGPGNAVLQNCAVN
jgi:hypothetical protein